MFVTTISLDSTAQNESARTTVQAEANAAKISTVFVMLVSKAQNALSCNALVNFHKK